MYTLLVVLHVVVAVFLIMVVLLQTGKGAAMGSAFGGGASQTMFGSAGAGNFLTKLTTGAAIVFMVTSMALTVTLSKKGERSVIKDEPVGQTSAPASATPPAPATPPAIPSAADTK